MSQTCVSPPATALTRSSGVPVRRRRGGRRLGRPPAGAAAGAEHRGASAAAASGPSDGATWPTFRPAAMTSRCGRHGSIGRSGAKAPSLGWRSDRSVGARSLPSGRMAPQLPPLPPPARRHARLRRRGRRVDRAGGRRPGLPAHRRRGAGAPRRGSRRTAARVAWTSWRDGAPEVYVADVRRWRGAPADLLGRPPDPAVGWTPDGEVLAVSAAGQPSRPPDLGVRDPGRRRRAPAAAATARCPTSRCRADGRGAARPRRCPGSRRGGSATAAARPASCGGTPSGGGEFVRLAAELDGQLDVADAGRRRDGVRIAFLSDHEGWGNLYSLGRRTAPTCAGTPTTAAAGAPAFYARHAATDGSRVVYECGRRAVAARLARRRRAAAPLDVRLGGPRTARAPHRLAPAA